MFKHIRGHARVYTWSVIVIWACLIAWFATRNIWAVLGIALTVLGVAFREEKGTSGWAQFRRHMLGAPLLLIGVALLLVIGPLQLDKGLRVGYRVGRAIQCPAAQTEELDLWFIQHEPDPRP